MTDDGARGGITVVHIPWVPLGRRDTTCAEPSEDHSEDRGCATRRHGFEGFGACALLPMVEQTGRTAYTVARVWEVNGGG